MTEKVLFWFRRDLRLSDNAGLFYALKENKDVQPIFIFDTDILNKLPALDLRVLFIHQTLQKLKSDLNQLQSDLFVYYGKPIDVFKTIYSSETYLKIYTNHDYEPEAIERDLSVKNWCDELNIEFKTYKDQVIFEKSEVLTDQNKPYTVFTPYKKKWLSHLSPFYIQSYPTEKYFSSFVKVKTISNLLTLESMNFKTPLSWKFPERKIPLDILKRYEVDRDFPFKNGTSLMGLHLRFGTLSVRKAVQITRKYSETWLSEIIWRDFFMQILWHFPHVKNESFNKKYDQIKWINNPIDIEKWKSGETGYPLVDAGMKELNQTGHMHNRVRMVVASFLCKHLLVHWSVGERYFSEKLLDYDLSANNGNWQWACGSGCDAAPYFRVFNPTAQQEKFDPDFQYIKKWIPTYDPKTYISLIVEHTFARDRALAAYKEGLKLT